MRQVIAEVKNLGLRIGERTLFSDLSFEVDKHTIVGLKGRNGAGKTTLCLAMAGIETAAERQGEILYEGKDVKDMTIAERARKVGIIFQTPDSRLFSPTVEDEVAFAPENLKLDRSEIKDRIGFALSLCGIEHLRGSRTDKLSGGEKQLVAIASVLSMKPELLIADEIFSYLDSRARERMRGALIQYSSSLGSVLMVSHSPSELSICGRRLELVPHED